MGKHPVRETFALGFPWTTFDPFLFCVHHLDRYPPANEKMGPDASLEGRNLGMDFELRDGWRMYHGKEVPGFPAHPHRGFETVTLARQGFIDHSDSLGAAARFGGGDVQWMTAGGGVVHAEMFPLLDRENRNTTELFQIWLNLPSEDKDADAHFAMLWREEIPTVTVADDEGRESEITVIAGQYGDAAAPAPPPSSWAARSDTHVAIWTIDLGPGAELTLPPGEPGINRSLYAYEGDPPRLAEEPLPIGRGARLVPDAPVDLRGGTGGSRLLLLQGRPIGEPVVQNGPFVATSPGEMRQAFLDYQRTRFGGWPWPSDAPVHARERGRFARHVDGRVETPDGPATGS